MCNKLHCAIIFDLRRCKHYPHEAQNEHVHTYTSAGKLSNGKPMLAKAVRNFIVI